MAESDESGKSQTSPAPELNPLLNPLLNKNLGRWAEVYFKCPPDRRDEAVLQLLRELEREDAQPQPGGAFSQEQPNGDVRNGDAGFAPENQPIICPSCGFAARPNQKFCGRCGVRLFGLATPPPVSEQDSYPEPLPMSQAEDTGRAFPSHSNEKPDRISDHDGVTEPSFSAVQETTPVWHSYRLYIAAVFAIVIVALGYLAWRSAQVAPPSSKLPEQVPSAVTPASSPAPAAQTANPVPSAPDQSAPSSQRAVEGTDSEGGSPSGASVAPQDRESNESAATPEKAPTSPLPETGSSNGSQELATAMEFLDGTGGKQADNAQAAQWLWKSVAKRNTEATLLLARLYLRGEGVQKNCDQGRILLDAAARKGNKGAASMLQNLQAFGCP